MNKCFKTVFPIKGTKKQTRTCTAFSKTDFTDQFWLETSLF